MKVKFSRIRLIAALRKSKERALEQYRKDVQAYHTKNEKAKDRLIENIEKYLAEVRRTKPNDIETSNHTVGSRLLNKADFTSHPREPRMEFVEGLIQQLELGVEDVVVCDTKEEYVRLTSACAILGTCKI